MAGLVPAIHVLQNFNMAGGYVYILTNRPNGILYVGVTSDLVRRIFEHRSGFAIDFERAATETVFVSRGGQRGSIDGRGL